jgi:outer membrane lipoprotein
MRPPARLAGVFPPTSIAGAQAGGHEGERVRWGGRIVSTTPGRAETCLEVVGLPLDREARPQDSDDSQGRFVACTPGFLDPAVYSRDREVTVVGTLEETISRPIGEYDYLFPRVRAETVYLWPKPEPVPAYWDPYPYPWFGPFWGVWSFPLAVGPHCH